MNDNTIEQLLRKAPGLKPPAGLREDLERQIELPNPPPRMTTDVSRPAAGWIRRWLPALSFAVWFLVCAVVFALQAARITELREQNMARAAAIDTATKEARAADSARAAAAAELEQLRRDMADVQRLRAETEQLRSEAAELATLRAQNQQLRDELKAQGKLPPRPEEDFFVVVSERATRTRCVNNLKQVCLAARMWANDHGDHLPSDYETMSQELNGDRITFCPKDGVTRYQILSPGVDEARPEIVYVRCPLHHIVGLVDGSVQQLADPRQLVQRDGKWILIRNDFE
jgi:hypothetical protein